MNTDLKLATTHLGRGAVQRIDDGRGILLQCLRGSLWLTQQDDRRDIVLRAGEEVVIERDGTSIVSALRDSDFVLLRDRQPRSPSISTAE
jgi:hypothetical protein